MTCTFFGHRRVTEEIGPALQAALTHLIVHKHVLTFYVGNDGSFDRMVQRQLRQLKSAYPQICCTVVLAYLPQTSASAALPLLCDTLYPAGLETVPPKYAIAHRNRWMLRRSDYVITYVRRSTGGAAQFQFLAEKQGKPVIKL